MFPAWSSVESHVAHAPTLMPSKDRVELLEAKLELTRYLAPEERAELSTITLPAIELAVGRSSSRRSS
jgi:hypothetical protein